MSTSNNHLRSSLKWVQQRWVRLTLAAFTVALITLFGSDYVVKQAAHARVFSSVHEVPKRQTALVLGTSRTVGGRPNLYFTFRMDAAEQLFRSGKVSEIIVSGDNSVKEYDEPTDMRDELVRRGIPDSIIVRDYAGFRTFDSMVRCSTLFGRSSVIVVSQQFHNERAIFIANNIGIDAIGFNARDVSTSTGLKTRIREYFARLAAVLDVYVLPTEPRFAR
ncbi:MAG TPA: ElyC/SanA/YdcF family protein [Chlorobiota bacterium]|nr:ElyC/SanA/YdcF family protein [Chlorobiota bacterium]